MTTDLTVWIPGVCAALSLPATPGRTEWFTRWAAFEGTGAAFNPLATTLPGIEDTANPYWNSFGPNGQYHVRNYRDMAAGVGQTAATIRQANFALILQSLQSEHVVPGVSGVIRTTWGTTGFADLLDTGWVPTGWGGGAPVPIPVPVPAFTDAQVAAVKGLIDGSFGPILLALLRQIVGLDESTWGASFAPSVAQLRAALTGATVPPHVHTPGSGNSGGVAR